MLSCAFVLIWVLLVVHIWDVYNFWIKLIFDGFIDAGLWKDDLIIEGFLVISVCINDIFMWNELIDVVRY